MKKYLQAVYQSFGSTSLYTQVIYRWIGSGLLYLVILAAVISVIVCVRMSYTIYRFNQDYIPGLASQVPTLTIANGEAKTDVAQPHVIRDNKQNALVVINTHITEDDQLPDEKGVIFVARNYMLTLDKKGITPDKNAYKRTEFSDFKQRTIVLNKQKVEEFFTSLPAWIFFCLPLLIFGYWVFLLVSTVMAACLSYVVTAYLPEEYNFETRMRMSAIAMTPLILISKLVETFTQYEIGFWVILSLLIIHLYLMVIGTRYHLKHHPDAI